MTAAAAADRPWASRGRVRPWRDIVERYGPEGAVPDSRDVGRRMPDRYVIERVDGVVSCRAIYFGGQDLRFAPFTLGPYRGVLFNFGCAGVGATALALAILWHWLDAEPRLNPARAFRDRFLGRGTHDLLVIHAREIRRWADDHLRRYPGATLEA